MSGSTIGGIAGGVIGWFVGGPAGAQWGWMIGSMAGAILMPEQFEGPRLNEAKTQTANDGVPLIYGYGTFPCAGNLAWVDEVKEHRKKESAKGGPETTTYSYTVSYMIVVCKGEISGYKLIKRNGKIVYDARTDAELSALGYSANEISETRAAQAAFLQRATLYYGTQTQMPDPTMVAVKGAGEVPAYTGIAYIVLKDDETREGEVSQYEFVVANCGERTDQNQSSMLLVTGTNTNPSGPLFAMAEAEEEPQFIGIPRASGADMSACVPGVFGGVWMAVNDGVRYSTDNGETWQSATLPTSLEGRLLVGGGDGWLTQDRQRQFGAGYARALSGPASFGSFQFKRRISPVEVSNVNWLTMTRYIGGYYYADQDGSLMRSTTLSDGEWELLGGYRPDGISWFHDVQLFAGELYVTVTKYIDYNLPGQQAFWQLRKWNGTDFNEVLINNPAADSDIQLWQMEANDNYLIVHTNGAEYVYTSADNFAVPHATGISGNSVHYIHDTPFGRQIAKALGRFFIISNNECVSTVDGRTFATPVSLPTVTAYGIVSGEGSLPPNTVPIPDAPGYYVNRDTGVIIGPPGTSIDVCRPTLGSIVSDQCNRRAVSTIDVSELTDDVAGYRVAAPSTPQRNIQGLQPGYFFSASEFDGTLHFPKRGRALTFALTHDDFVERDGDPIQWERTQEAELLRKVTVGYVDPDTTYTATTQQAERRAATISAEGESTIELAVTGSKDWAAQVADKSIKVAWGEPDECTFHVTIDHAELVTGAEGTVPYLDGTDTVIRIDRIEDEGLVRMVTGRRTRANLYESNASGAAKPLPRFPGSEIRGPTDGLLLNIPVLVDSNDVPGIHWIAAGMTAGWAGAQLQILRAGQWLVAGEATGAGVGTLLSALPDHAGDFDTANVLHVHFNDTLESVSYVNLLQERNPLAILRADGTAEIVQFQTATEVAAGEYELTGLLRGRLATTTSLHAAGARVVALDDRVQYATLEPTDVGQVVSYRFVSLGTDPDAAPIQTITLTTMESQREWPVYDLAVEQDGDDFTLTWRQRDRLGSDVLPIRSTHWAGYQVSYSHPGGSDSVTVTTESHTFTLPGASDITFSVAQLNQFTGAGPAQTVTIP